MTIETVKPLSELASSIFFFFLFFLFFIFFFPRQKWHVESSRPAEETRGARDIAIRSFFNPAAAVARAVCQWCKPRDGVHFAAQQSRPPARPANQTNQVNYHDTVHVRTHANIYICTCIHVYEYGSAADSRSARRSRRPLKLVIVNNNGANVVPDNNETMTVIGHTRIRRRNALRKPFPYVYNNISVYACPPPFRRHENRMGHAKRNFLTSKLDYRHRGRRFSTGRVHVA